MAGEAAAAPGHEEGAPQAGAPLGGGARVALALAWLTWVGGLLLPFVAIVLVSWVGAAFVAASAALLRGDGFTLPMATFNRISGVVFWVALAGWVRQLLLWASPPPRQARQREIGPGGRVLRRIPVPQADLPQSVTARLACWLPTPIMFVAPYCIVGLVMGKWLHVRIPVSWTHALVLAPLYFLIGYGGLWILRGTWWIAGGVYRFAGRSAYRAGAMTVLLGLLGAPVTIALVLGPARSTPAPSPDELGDLGEVSDTQALVHLALYEIAALRQPREAIRQDVARFLAPLLDQARAERSGPLARAPSPWESHTLLAGLGGAGLEGDDVDNRFRKCMSQLWPEEFQKAVRKVRTFRRIARDERYDVAMSVLIDVCDTYMKEDIQRLPEYFWLATKRRAVDWYRKARYVTCDGVETRAVCPVPGDSPEEQAIKSLGLAQIQWCELQPREKALILEKHVLDAKYEEIAAQYPGMTPTGAKNATNNTMKRIREKLGGECLKDKWYR
jgi:DNA-directed RNA polymerase specialized sigma24 family protein